jgi:hypothetical protein
MGSRGALEGHVEPVAQRMHRAHQYASVFIHRDRLAREGRFIHLELRDLDEPKIGGHLVASLQQHNVTRHEHVGWHLLNLTAAQHRGQGGRQPLQRGQRLVGAPGLHKPDGRVEQHDHQDHQGVHQIAHQGPCAGSTPCARASSWASRKCQSSELESGAGVGLWVMLCHGVLADSHCLAQILW